MVLSYKARNKSGELEVPADLDTKSLVKRGLTPDVAGQLQKTYLNHAWLESVKLDEFELGYQTKEETGYIVFKWFDEETIKEYAV